MVSRPVSGALKVLALAGFARRDEATDLKKGQIRVVL